MITACSLGLADAHDAGLSWDLRQKPYAVRMQDLG